MTPADGGSTSSGAVLSFDGGAAEVCATCGGWFEAFGFGCRSEVVRHKGKAEDRCKHDDCDSDCGSVGRDQTVTTCPVSPNVKRVSTLLFLAFLDLESWVKELNQFPDFLGRREEPLLAGRIIYLLTA